VKLQSIAIKNFRCFEDATIQLDDYTALIGPNGCGKSAVLSALNVFFGEKTSAIPVPNVLSSDAFHHHNHGEPIIVKLTFANLTADEKAALADYVRADKLIVSAEAIYDPASETAPVKQYGYRLGVKKFAPFFELLNDGAKVDELIATYGPLATEFSLTISGRQTKAAMETALRDYEGAHPELCVELKSEDQFYGFTRGVHKLKPFVQYIYLPAVKDAAEEELEARVGVLGTLVSRIVRSQLNLEGDLDAIQLDAFSKLQKLFDGHKANLDKLSRRLTYLAKNLFPAMSAVIMKWNEELGSQVKIDSPLVSVDIDDSTFSGPVSKFGHGIQRSYILALLQLFAETATDAGTAKVIFACEEPELYQHPPQARHLAEALLQISKKHGQVIATTHSPYFISGENFAALRMLKVKNKKVVAKSALYTDVSRIIADAKCEKPNPQSAIHAGLIQKLQPPLNEMFFSRFAVLVEGPEDIAYLRTQFDLRSKWSEFLSLGGHIVPVGGKEAMVSPAAICEALEHPFFCILDGDKLKFGDDAYTKALATLAKIDLTKIVAGKDHFSDRAIIWIDKIGSAVASDFGADWQRAHSVTCKTIGVNEGTAAKNPLLINLTLSVLSAANKYSQTLDTAINQILKFGTSLD
jgi:putative ATP-dependent endonuclease of the OLD family